MNDYAVVFLLRPTSLPRRERFFERSKDRKPKDFWKWCPHKVSRNSKSHCNSKFITRSKFTTRSIFSMAETCGSAACHALPVIQGARYFEYTCVRYLWQASSFIPVGIDEALDSAEAARRVKAGGLSAEDLAYTVTSSQVLGDHPPHPIKAASYA